MLLWVVLLTIAAAALLWLRRRELRDGHRGGAVRARLIVVAIVLLAVLGAAGASVQIIRIGHSGADAAWSDVV